MQLPSPIPHPLSLLGVPEELYGPLEFVIGADWPEGNEKLIWDLADDCYQTAQALLDPGRAAAAAAGQVIAGWGGPGTAVGAAFSEEWHQLGATGEEAFHELKAALDGLGDKLEGCGCDIEAAKIETWIETILLAMEILAFLIAALVTFGAALTGCAPAIALTRMLIQRIFRKLLGEVAKRALSKGVREGVERLGEQVGKRAITRFAARGTRQSFEEGLEEVGTEYATQSHQIDQGRRAGYDSTSLMMSAAGGAAGGFAGGLAGLGRNATSGAGRFFESVGRGAGGELLGEIGASVATGHGLPELDDMARSVTSGGVSGYVGGGRAAAGDAFDQLAGLAHLSGPAGGLLGLPDLVELAGPAGAGISSDSEYDGAAPGGTPLSAPVAAAPDMAPSTLDAHVSAAPSIADTAPAISPTTSPTPPTSAAGSTADSPVRIEPAIGMPTTDTALAGVAGLADPPTTSPASPPGITQSPVPGQPGIGQPPTGQPPIGQPPIGQPMQPGLTTTAASAVPVTPPAPPAVPVTPPAPPAVPVTPPGPPATPAPPTPGTPSTVIPPPMTATPTGVVGRASVPPIGQPPKSVPGLIHPWPTPAPVQRNPVGTLPETTAGLDSVAFQAHLDTRQRRLWLEDDRRTRTAEALQAMADEVSIERLRLKAEIAQMRLDDPRLAAAWARYEQLDRQFRDLEYQATEVREGRLVPDLVEVVGEEHIALNLDRFPTSAGAVETGRRSSVTGLDVPPPVDKTRPYHERGGLRPPLAVDQVALERTMPREPDGTLTRRPHPMLGWFQRVNDGGPAADATRGLNCVDAVLSLFETYVHGRPRVAAPRTFDAYHDGDPKQPVGGELGGPQRAERLLGGQFSTAFYHGSPATYRVAIDEVRRQLLAGGPGSFAMLAHTRPDGGAHTWAAVNHQDTIYFLDPQTGEVNVDPLYDTDHDIDRLDVLIVDSDAQPMPPVGFDAGRLDTDPTGPAAPQHPPADRPRDPWRMRQNPTEAELRALGVGAVTVADLGLDATRLDPVERERYEGVLDHVAMIDVADIRVLHRSVEQTSPTMSPSHPALTLATAEGPWVGDAIHVVRWGDGSVTSTNVDLLLAARAAGVGRVPVIVHGPLDQLDGRLWTPQRRDAVALRADVRVLEDGTWAIGDSRGEIVYPSDTVPRNWGQLAHAIAIDQPSLLPGHLFGTDIPPMLVEPSRPIGPPPGVSPADQEQLARVVAAAAAAAPTIQAAIESAAADVSRALGLAQPITLWKTEHRVKELDSLIRKFALELQQNKTVVDFVEKVNDVVRFTAKMPDGAMYVPTMQALLHSLETQGYTVVPGSIKNFWHPGNRHYGTNVTLRTPQGLLAELQLPTALSIHMGSLTHDLYKVVRQPQESTYRRVHAFLAILSINKRLGMTAATPPQLDAVVPPTSTELLRWLVSEGQVWEQYEAMLNENGRRFTDVIAEYGLTSADLDLSDAATRRMTDADLGLLRDLRERHLGAPGRDDRPMHGA